MLHELLSQSFGSQDGLVLSECYPLTQSLAGELLLSALGTDITVVSLIEMCSRHCDIFYTENSVTYGFCHVCPKTVHCYILIFVDSGKQLQNINQE